MPGFRVFCDIETTGLDESMDYVLEVAFAVTDIYGEVIDARDWLVPIVGDWWKFNAITRAKADPVVGKMHESSGLWKDLDDVTYSKAELEIEEEIVDWLCGFNLPKVPLAGSSVSFDRKFISKYFPAVHDLFTYRNIDVSSVKELCKDLAPEVYAKLSTETHPQKLHRALPDVLDTIEEYKFYLTNFLKVDK